MIALFGCRSPLVVEYIETCLRRDKPVFGVSIGSNPRSSQGFEVVDIDTYRAGRIRHPVLPCAFGPRRRKELWDIANDAGCELAETLVDPSAILPRGLRLGRGGFFNAGTVVGGECFIGDGVVINRAASVGHHCLVGDFVSIGPGATLAGNIRIGNLAVIGAGATVLPGIRIGAGAVVAAGAVVRKHVPENTLVSGHPALPQRYDVTKGILNIFGEE